MYILHGEDLNWYQFKIILDIRAEKVKSRVNVAYAYFLVVWVHGFEAFCPTSFLWNRSIFARLHWLRHKWNPRNTTGEQEKKWMIWLALSLRSMYSVLYRVWFLKVDALRALWTNRYTVAANNSSFSCSTSWCPEQQGKKNTIQWIITRLTSSGKFRCKSLLYLQLHVYK